MTRRPRRALALLTLAGLLVLLAATPAQAVDLTVPGCQPIDYRLPAGSSVTFTLPAGCVYDGTETLEGDPTVIEDGIASTVTVLLTGNAQRVAVYGDDGTRDPNYNQWVYSCGATVTYDYSLGLWSLVDYCPQPTPPDVLQQVGTTAQDGCASADDPTLNIGGAEAGGWARSWAQWAHDGRGGAVCTRTLTYNNSVGHYVVAS